MKHKRVVHTTFYATEAEAIAFIEGIEFVNDSDLDILRRKPPNEKEWRWTVKIAEWKEVK